MAAIHKMDTGKQANKIAKITQNNKLKLNKNKK